MRDARAVLPLSLHALVVEYIERSGAKRAARVGALVAQDLGLWQMASSAYRLSKVQTLPLRAKSNLWYSAGKRLMQQVIRGVQHLNAWGPRTLCPLPSAPVSQ